MRKFKPLDLSFMAAAGSPERESFRNVAAMINANAGWVNGDDVSAAYEKQLKDQKKAYASAHKPSFLSGLFDLLSTPLYGVANALDESIAGHQEDNNDNVTEDIGKVLGGIVTGAGRGVGAGLRGATSMLDGIPGVDISDEWQRDPTDKRRFTDVGVRLTAKMSSEDVAKPENWDKAAANIQGEKDEVPGWLQDIFYTDLNAKDAQQQYLDKMRIIGLAEDIGGDPLNFATFGAKAGIGGAKAAIEGVEAARAANSAGDISTGLKLGEGMLPKAMGGNKFKDAPIPSARSLDDIAPAGGIDVPIAPSPYNAMPNGGVAGIYKDTLKTKQAAAGVKRSKAIPKEGVKVDPLQQSRLVKEIAKLAESGKPDWTYKAGDLLRKHKGVEWTNTERFIDLADKMAKAQGGRHNYRQIGELLKSRIADDAAAAAKPKVARIVPAERILNTARAEDIIQAPIKTKLKKPQAKIANSVVVKFRNQILGTEKAPGTYEGLAYNIVNKVNARWSGPQQVRVLNDILTKLQFNGPQKYEVAAKILQHVEDYFITRGAIPHSGTNLAHSVEGLRLSQLMMAIGPRTLADNPSLITRILKGDEKALKSLTAEQRQAIENLKASEAMASAPATAQAIQAGKDFASEILAKVQSPGRAKYELANAAKVAEKTTVKLGGGPVAAKVARDYVTHLVRNPTGVDAVINANRLKTEAWLADAVHGMPKNDPNFLISVTRAVYKAADLPTPAALGKIAGPLAKVKDSFGAMFMAHYGVKDMNPIVRRNQASALSLAATRAKFINEIAQKYPPKDIDLWHEAMRGAQRDAITEGNIAGLQSEIAKVVESLFGGTGLRAGAMVDSTVVGRGRITMDELNSQLRRFGLGEFQFVAKKVKNAAGETRDFSKGADWMKSWEMWDIKKPYDFLHRIQDAVQHTVSQKIMFDEIAARFGSPNKHGGVKYRINHPRLQGFYFTEAAARQGEVMLGMLKDINTPNSKMLQHLDHVISKMKASLTIYIPAHHWTNVIGDTSVNWYAGVNNPIRYDQAARVISSQRHRYGDIVEWQRMVASPDAAKKAIARSLIGNDTMSAAGLKTSAKGNAVIITMRNGTKVTADMLWTAGMREGIFPSARVLEEITSDVSSVLDKFRPLGGKGQKLAHQVSEWRDHTPRMAQFIDGIAKSGSSFDSAVIHSAGNVRKWHPDGLDLTRFEKQVMKRVFPFYSWTRKAIPLAIESAIVASPKVMAYPRLMELFAAINGIVPEDGTAGGAFPSDQMFPDFLRERGIGPIAGGPGNYLVVNPSTPALDIFALMGHPGQGAIDMLNPMAKVPLELAQGSTLGKTVPIENQADYLSRQIPGLSQAGRVSGYFGTSDSVANSDQQKFLNLMNILLGTKATQSGIYQKSAQYDLRDYLTQKAKGHQ